MDADQPSLQLLAKFDAEDNSIVSCPALSKRGILWVMKWASTAASLLYAATVLTEFACSLAGEQLLARAARAGALEAMLPRATVQSVHQSIERRLSGRLASPGELSIMLLDNGAPVTKRLQPRGGDRLSITLAIPSQALMPDWLRVLTSWRGDSKITAHAERTMPGRTLAGS